MQSLMIQFGGKQMIKHGGRQPMRKTRLDDRCVPGILALALLLFILSITKPTHLMIYFPNKVVQLIIQKYSH